MDENFPVIRIKEIPNARRVSSEAVRLMQEAFLSLDPGYAMFVKQDTEQAVKNFSVSVRMKLKPVLPSGYKLCGRISYDPKGVWIWSEILE